MSESMDIDTDTETPISKASRSVVSLISYVGEWEAFYCSGTIIECEGVGPTYSCSILTCADLVRFSDTAANNIKVLVYLWDGMFSEGKLVLCDLHYNLALFKIDTNIKPQVASLRFVHDAFTLDLSPPPVLFQCLHSGSSSRSRFFNIFPGDEVTAVGRYFKYPFHVLTAPGTFRTMRFKFDCDELMGTTCKIDPVSLGGPLMNNRGEVIGITYYNSHKAPFLPTNLVARWLDRHKNNESMYRPWLGVKLRSLYSASLETLEDIFDKFPGTFRGVIVDKVIGDSPDDSVKLYVDDVIVKCNGKHVGSALEFFEMIWDNPGRAMKVTVLRAVDGTSSRIKITPGQTMADAFNKWWPPMSIQRGTKLRRKMLRSCR